MKISKMAESLLRKKDRHPVPGQNQDAQIHGSIAGLLGPHPKTFRNPRLCCKQRMFDHVNFMLRHQQSV
jgi:hypothetical protein